MQKEELPQEPGRKENNPLSNKEWIKSDRMDDLIKGVKIGKLLTKDEKKNETKKIIGIVLGIIAVIAAIAGGAYCIYKFVNRDYYDDFEDDFADLFEDDEEDDFEEE